MKLSGVFGAEMGNLKVTTDCHEPQRQLIELKIIKYDDHLETIRSSLMHSNPHPKAGQSFRINIDDGKSPAGYDQMLHGSLFRLVDWADRMDVPSAKLSRQKERALTFYAHRCLPNLDSPDRNSIPLAGLVYGFFEVESRNPGREGNVYRSIAVLRETELVDID